MSWPSLLINAVFELRKATIDDKPAIERLIGEAARGLSRDDYTDQQIDAAISSIFGVDTELIVDGTYFVVVSDGRLIGCGGWSKRKTLFGGDQYGNRDSGPLDPTSEPAKIRAFFVHPSWARKGVARAILETCEREAMGSGFCSLELMATLPGLKFYEAQGYEREAAIECDLDGVRIEFVPMRKRLRSEATSSEGAGASSPARDRLCQTRGKGRVHPRRG